jgi:hypothetical protein
MDQFSEREIEALHTLLQALIHQENAEVLIPAKEPAPGFWFGGGKLAIDHQGVIWLSGRYRNAGDSRTGLEAGVRGAECAIFRLEEDPPGEIVKVHSWTKKDLAYNGEAVISIEGTALHPLANGEWELYLSVERTRKYPAIVHQYQKPGTGVWGIDRITGQSPDTLEIRSLKPVLWNSQLPAYLHVKDPLAFDDPSGRTILVYCSHPYTWSSDNSGYALRENGKSSFAVQSWEMVPRGATWDVAVTRITSRLMIPKLGIFADTAPTAVYFYDGAECMRSHMESDRAQKRPRGYSCEEIGGAMVGRVREFPQMERLSVLKPFFVSPWGTGASRYIDCVTTAEGILAVWQQAQTDGSQPLVGHYLPLAEVERILS